MGLRAPVAVAVEVRADDRRVFRLAASVGEDGVRLVRTAPFELGRPVEVRLALPTSGAVLELTAEVRHADIDDERLNEGAGGRELVFLHPAAEAREAIRGYVSARLGLPS